MSKDIIVLAPNGRRQKVHCTPDTSMLQVLEDVCSKQGFQATDYDLKHHNHILDLTITIRFSNLPNKAMLEMVEAERKREESIVTVGLLLEDGDRRTAEFPPNTSLYDLINSLAPVEFESFQQPTILYMRQEVVGELALKEKTLRQLGLLGGRAILRLLNKAEEAKQANVSTVYRIPISDKGPASDPKADHKSPEMESETTQRFDDLHAGPSNTSKDVSKSIDPVSFLRREKRNVTINDNKPKALDDLSNANVSNEANKQDSTLPSASSSSISIDTQKNLERRLNIEEEVTFLGTQKAIAFMQSDEQHEELDDLPDDFYELTIEEVRKLYHNLQQNRLELENTPLITASKKEELAKQTSEYKLKLYKNVVVRIQFPDRIILQGVFTPGDKVQDIINFIKTHLQYPEKPFHIFTTPLKETLDPNMTLLDAKFVPCVHMHFKWMDDGNDVCLKPDIYDKKTSSDAARILASKYRAPSRRKMEEAGCSRNPVSGSSTARDSKLPKWFKK